MCSPDAAAMTPFLQLVVCGTITDVGKTIVGAWLVQGLQAQYWKPVQSGLEDGGDRGRVRDLLNLPAERRRGLCLPAARVSPLGSRAGRGDAQPRTSRPANGGWSIGGTAGGLMVPLTREWLQIDQLRQGSCPWCWWPAVAGHTQSHPADLEAFGDARSRCWGSSSMAPTPITRQHWSSSAPCPLGHLPPLQPLTADALNQEWSRQNLDAVIKHSLEEAGEDPPATCDRVVRA